MTDANPLAWVLASLKTHPEPVSIPDVSELTPLELAAIRSRLQTFSQVATGLRKLVDEELAGRIPVALRYGDDVYRPSNGRGSAKVVDEAGWWREVIRGLQSASNPEALLAALYPASSVRLTALPKLAAAFGDEADDFKARHIAYDESSTPLSVMPLAKAPKYLQDLEEGEIR